MSAVCIIPNCRRSCAADEPFCTEHRDKPALPAEVFDAIRRAADFAAAEADNRCAAGSAMTDYLDDAQRVVSELDGLIAKYRRGL